MPATVLIVDDESAAIEIMEDILESRGYRVLATNNPERVLVLMDVDTRRIDVLLVDVVMPQRPGPDIAAWVCQRWPDCQVIFMSGYPLDRLAEYGVPAGARILTKPIAVAVLLDAVRAALGPEG
jgi:two-component system cell cycle sensor histidine kinase/response regulator CckA